MSATAAHRHRDPVRLPDGSTITACSFPDDGYAAEIQPRFGLYLDSRWQPPWDHGLVHWPDFGLPADDDALADALDHLLELARRGQVVELGCLGGHGRTGTALACLVAMVGGEQDPVDWVRNNYCPRAIETAEQAAYAHAFTTRQDRKRDP